MKTVRFSNVVETAGKPDTYLLLVAPEKDAKFKSLIKAQRVATLYQASVGSKTDHAEVGFQAGPSRQYLVFPKSLSRFAGKRIVGVKYDLLEDASAPAPKKAKPLELARKKQAPKASPKVKATASPAKGKVVSFPTPEKEPEEENEAVEEIKAQVQRAMDALEKGRQVAAFNLLKRIVEK